MNKKERKAFKALSKTFTHPEQLELLNDYVKEVIKSLFSVSW